jgi:hypothetical protein
LKPVKLKSWIQSQAACRFIARQVAGINARRLFSRQAR